MALAAAGKVARALMSGGGGVMAVQMGGGVAGLDREEGPRVGTSGPITAAIAVPNASEKSVFASATPNVCFTREIEG